MLRLWREKEEQRILKESPCVGSENSLLHLMLSGPPSVKKTHGSSAAPVCFTSAKCDLVLVVASRESSSIQVTTVWAMIACNHELPSVHCVQGSREKTMYLGKSFSKQRVK